ncbi:UNVERIFIED_CONTAM: hypothetical protein GTU68_056536 [Idotea baltica]|nr:hypothetical protein [Idotea baltica]
MTPKDPLQNVNPHIFEKASSRQDSQSDWDDSVPDPFDPREIFDLIRSINDPEHPLSLEELKVVEEDKCDVDDAAGDVSVLFTPTIPHCSMASLIGLSIKLKLLRTLPSRFKVTVRITPGSHSSEDALNKQLNDKERVAAALENPHLLDVINKCLNPKARGAG